MIGSKARVNTRGANEMKLPLGLEIEIIRRVPGAHGRRTDGKNGPVPRAGDLWIVAYKSAIQGYETTVMTPCDFEIINSEEKTA